MNRRTAFWILGGILVAFIAVWLAWFAMGGIGTMATSTPATSTTNLPPGAERDSAATSSVKLAFLDTAGTSDGPSRGCDKVQMVSYTVATTTAPLTAAMKTLFALSTTSVGGWFNYIDRTNETLKFDHATVVGGTANIYLTGSLSGLAGVCDDPRAAIQIEETARQFPTVQNVQIYLDGEKTSLIPSER